MNRLAKKNARGLIDVAAMLDKFRRKIERLEESTGDNRPMKPWSMMARVYGIPASALNDRVLALEEKIEMFEKYLGVERVSISASREYQEVEDSEEQE